MDKNFRYRFCTLCLGLRKGYRRSQSNRTSFENYAYSRHHSVDDHYDDRGYEEYRNRPASRTRRPKSPFKEDSDDDY